MKPVVYIAGPFRSKQPGNEWEREQNIRRAEWLALEVWKAGYACICPHANTRNFQGALPDDVWLDGDIAILLKCDAVLMTPDWGDSVGACQEREFAREAGIPVYYNLGDLVSGLHAAADAATSLARRMERDG